MQRAAERLDGAAGQDAPPAVAAPALRRPAPRCLGEALAARPADAGAPTPWSSATWATSTCTWPAVSSRTPDRARPPRLRPRHGGRPPRESRLLLRALGALDRAALRAADVIVVDTAEHRELIPEESRGRATVVAVGTPETWFWPPRRSDAPARCGSSSSAASRRCRARRSSARRSAARRRRQDRDDDGRRGQDAAATRRAAAANPRVTWIDWVEPEALPYLVAVARRLPRHLRRQPEGTAGRAEQGVPGRRRRLRRS